MQTLKSHLRFSLCDLKGTFKDVSIIKILIHSKCTAHLKIQTWLSKIRGFQALLMIWLIRHWLCLVTLSPQR